MTLYTLMTLSEMSINIIQKAFTSSNRKESVIRHDSSPVKTVLGKILLCIINYKPGTIFIS